MSRVKGKDTKPELIVRKILHSMGYRYRLHHPNLPGKPDIVLSRHKKIVLVNGCFWHGHENCNRAKLPTTNHDFWANKIAKNMERDRFNINELEERGWEVLTIWSCEISKSELLKTKLAKFMRGSNNA
jgi:DNA mismatch endonuclease (patch repair protein)